MWDCLAVSVHAKTESSRSELQKLRKSIQKLAIVACYLNILHDSCKFDLYAE